MVERVITAKSPEKLFAGIRVYYSGSIKGAPELDPNFAWELVKFMKEGGAEILSEHVAARTKEEMREMRARNIGMTTEDWSLIEGTREKDKIIRATDLLWVYQATHVVALINAPSHGVGEEIQTAILKPSLGLNPTPILCLVHETQYNNLSSMIKGVVEDECPDYFVKTYTSLEEAKRITAYFLMGRLN